MNKPDIKLLVHNKKKLVPWWLSQVFAISLALTICGLINFIRTPIDDLNCLVWFVVFFVGVSGIFVSFTKVADLFD